MFGVKPKDSSCANQKWNSHECRTSADCVCIQSAGTNFSLYLIGFNFDAELIANWNSVSVLLSWWLVRARARAASIIASHHNVDYGFGLFVEKIKWIEWSEKRSHWQTNSTHAPPARELMQWQTAAESGSDGARKQIFTLLKLHPSRDVCFLPTALIKCMFLAAGREREKGSIISLLSALAGYIMVTHHCTRWKAFVTFDFQCEANKKWSAHQLYIRGGGSRTANYPTKKCESCTFLS